MFVYKWKKIYIYWERSRKQESWFMWVKTQEDFVMLNFKTENYVKFGLQNQVSGVVLSE